MASNDYCHFNQGNTNTTFTINVFDHELTIYQNPGNQSLGHGAVVWDAAVVFAKYMEHNPKDFQASKLADQTVLELGSGCALAGSAMMLRGAKVTFTDLLGVVASLTERNAERIYYQARQSLSEGLPLHKPTVLPLDWTQHSPEHLAGFQDKYDIILLTDCIFSMDLLDDIVEILLHFSTPKTTVICCHEIRDEGINKAFVERLGAHFTLKHIAKAKLHPDYRNDFISIIYGKLSRKK